MRTPDLQGVNRLRSFKEVADITGVGYSTLKVMIRDGRGPRVTRLSERIVRISDADLADWVRKGGALAVA
jgi:predicted DNA-binding transcriptional regulator AlpA